VECRFGRGEDRLANMRAMGQDDLSHDRTGHRSHDPGRDPSRDPSRDPIFGSTWADTRQDIVPLLARESVPGGPLTVWLDPGLRVGFGLDLGVMFVHVTEALLRAWRVDPETLSRQAIGNLRMRAGTLDAHAAIRTRLGLVSVSVLQAPDGCASSLVLAPDLLPRWFGGGPWLFIAPARNLLMALPPRTDQRLARSVRDEIAAQVPGALDVPPLYWDGSRLRRQDADPGPRLASSAGRTNAIPRRTPRTVPPRRWGAPLHGALTTWYTPPPDRSVR
jgi:hypothetical protein